MKLKKVMLLLPEEVASMLDEDEELLTLRQMEERVGQSMNTISTRGQYHRDWTVLLQRGLRLYRVKFWEER